MVKLSGNGECKPKKLNAIIGAAIENAPFREYLSMDYTYQQLQLGFPNTMQQSKTMQVDDLKWTEQHIPISMLGLTGQSNQCLIYYRYVVDKPQLACDTFKGHPFPCDIPGETFLFLSFFIIIVENSISHCYCFKLIWSLRSLSHMMCWGGYLILMRLTLQSLWKGTKADLGPTSSPILTYHGKGQDYFGVTEGMKLAYLAQAPQKWCR